MESVAFRFADIFDQLNSIFPDIEVVASGGALSASPIWTQIIADVLGHDIGLSSATEASLHGAVLIALANTGKIELSDTISAAKNTIISFHPKCREIYQKARKRHLQGYEKASKPETS
jgi:sugar (pentulose or hexulose) kinase